jgi:hypothetical protein
VTVESIVGMVSMVVHMVLLDSTIPYLQRELTVTVESIVSMVSMVSTIVHMVLLDSIT